jgi:hypothetical protein
MHDVSHASNIVIVSISRERNSSIKTPLPVGYYVSRVVGRTIVTYDNVAFVFKTV